MDWRKLQNGSDIRGVALEGIEGEHVNLTHEVIVTIAKSFVKWLRNTTGHDAPTIAVGMDCRLSGERIKSAFVDGAVEAGAHVVDCELASTPAMFMTTISEQVKAQASVMVTASHLPFNRNGLKFFTPKGGLDSKDIAAILDIAAKGDYAFDGAAGSSATFDFMSVYSRHLADYICAGVNADDYLHPLSGMHIIVDAGNGNGGFFQGILRSLGADTEGSQFLEPDGHFPNHIPNPENPEAMASVCKAVERSHADLGVIFDTDVDRSAIIGLNGEPINRNSLIALISAVILEEHPGSTVVTDSVTSDGLAEFIKEKGGKHHRFRRGYKNVINEGIRLNEAGEGCWLAIEIISTLKQPKESKEIRIKLTEPDFKAYGAKVLEGLKAQVADVPGWSIVEPNYEGLRVSCGNSNEEGWFLLRMSLHDPVMPLNIESNVEGGVAVIESKLQSLGLI